MAHKLKIGLYQSTNEYGSLHIIVTNNGRYLKERLVCDGVDEALEKIGDWLRKRL